jgi:radical SAM protein with 4Fe4S-binding SPASM domain
MQKIKFRFSNRHFDEFNTPGVLNLMFVDLTNRCNLKCRYCFNHHKLGLTASHLDLRLIEKTLQSPTASRAHNWFLSGGEPLTYPFLDEALALFHQYGQRPKIATNGILLTPETVDRWVSFGVQSVQFSLDTLNPDTFRELNAGSTKSLERILENIKYMVASPLRVVTSSVLTKANCREIVDLMQFSRELGVDSYTLYPNVPARKSNRDLVLSIPEQMELFHELFAFYDGLDSKRLVDLSIPCFQYSDVYTRWKDLLNIRQHPCGAGQFNLKITSEGTVSACICQDAPEFIVGDLHKQTIDEIWNSPEIERFRNLYKDVPECGSCGIRDTCRGGCRNEAFVAGSQGIYSSDPHCSRYHQSNDSTRH